ncbi:GNAT family N-acetyltransferase [Paenibacillus macquariensis]|uniref:L-amino acid N-acyltransferase YncA n=1 Tax=Paenibacillus macquariensis TaxID=948756 RepID=A0ABY1JU50_9BACL|nr:GNAT family N-acetyltransferase [Paenibacillus macquariensis]MEC0091000.1 GNAT family N-acetyltransferase [Paenibacillus macquariensis]OAB34719.1 GCN5 family acetyltransferase [Paenibacillus macquariensis subsp. macquariensis]SIQ78947.1 L-amino acid N-acyltransferase YncA [Paenibacillus macquariensis]
MANHVEIKLLHSIDNHMDELSELLIQVVEDGASIGFIPPVNHEEAEHYWGNVLEPGVILFVATINDVIVGTVQLQLCMKLNGSHRAKVAKLMTHPNYRRNGIGRALMQTVDERAKQEGRSLLVLDTREGDPSDLLYTSVGYIQAGRIPNYAKSASGELDATIYYYKSTE